MINHYVPWKEAAGPPKRPMHITALLKQNKMYKLYKLNPSPKTNYTMYDNAVANWYDQSESRLCENPNSAKFQGYAIKKVKSRSHIPPLTNISDTTFLNIATSNEDKAELLNLTFRKVLIKNTVIVLT